MRDVEKVTLREALERKTVDELKQLAKLVPDLRVSGKKSTILEQLAIGIEARIGDLVGQLDDLQYAMVSHAIHDAWWSFDANKFYAIHDALPERRRVNFSSLFVRLSDYTSLDLFFYDNVLPRDLGELARAHVEPVDGFEIQQVEQIPEVIHRLDLETQEAVEVTVHSHLSESLALHEVTEAMQLVESGGLRFTAKTDTPTAGSLRKMSEVLRAPDWLESEACWAESIDVAERERRVGPVRAYGWASLFVGGGFAKAAGQKSALTKQGRALMGEPPARVIRALWEEWLDQDRFDELRRVQAIKGQGSGRYSLTSPPMRRRAIVDVLRAIEPGKWVRVEQLMRAMIVWDKIPRVTAHHLHDLYIERPGYGMLSHEGSFEVLEGSYTRAFLVEYASTLGLVDLAYVSPDLMWSMWQGAWWAEDMAFLSPYDGLLAIRVTPLGAWLLGQRESYQGAQHMASHLKVLPNLDVVCVGEITPSTRMMLDTWGEAEGERTWRLSTMTLLMGADRGRDPEDLRAFLERASEEALPQTVTLLFEDVRRRSAMIARGEEVVSFEVASHAVALEIAHDRRTRSLCRVAGETTLLVPAPRVESFRKAVLQLGYVVGR